MPDAPLRVFISYARADSIAFVDRLESDLKGQQFHPWVDRHGLEGGQEWMEIIQEAIDDCLALVVVVTPAAVQSQYVRMEYRYAARHGKLVIPALHLPTPRTPMDLDILQWVDFQAGYEEGLRRLVQALGRLKPPVVPPAVPPPVKLVYRPPATYAPTPKQEQPARPAAPQPITPKPNVGTALFTFKGVSLHEYAVSWSPDGTKIACGDGDKAIQVWDTATGKILAAFRERSSLTYAVAWSPDGTRVAWAG